jgi:hypothetical protein
MSGAAITAVAHKPQMNLLVSNMVLPSLPYCAGASSLPQAEVGSGPVASVCISGS